MLTDPLAAWLDELEAAAAAKQTGDAELDMLAGPIHLDPTTVAALVRVVRAADDLLDGMSVEFDDELVKAARDALDALRALVEGR